MRPVIVVAEFVVGWFVGRLGRLFAGVVFGIKFVRVVWYLRGECVDEAGCEILAVIGFTRKWLIHVRLVGRGTATGRDQRPRLHTCGFL